MHTVSICLGEDSDALDPKRLCGPHDTTCDLSSVTIDASIEGSKIDEGTHRFAIKILLNNGRAGVVVVA
jgi:hypothetical protein